MTDLQKEKLINQAHDILDQDGVVAIKFAYSSLEMQLCDRYKEKEYDEVVRALYSDNFNGYILDRVPNEIGKKDYVVICVGQSDSYDAHEFLGMILSNLMHIGPDSAKCI